ncbi:ankyrin repeat domain-containing protein [Myxococcus landrumensis]|uniref:Ankyrin repeat domain-containing protein n=1 Tax=Myxococcus landrumensis TaxID=2813577 RepID=A0ABX7N0R1_9BACT|nr:ankyrin repeat domain-containing protein [Myxococcus landrumus]QSQ12290.1 ankyrin repeat domain-containing protein [Myxococcus landrumus]
MRPSRVRVLVSLVLVCLFWSGSTAALSKRRIIHHSERESDVIEAALDNDTSELRQLLSRVHAVNGPGDGNQSTHLMTPLMVAAERGHVAFVRILLEAKADPRLRVPRHSESWPPYGWSARCFARAARKPGTEELLAQAGTSGDAKCLMEADFLVAVRKQDVQHVLSLGRRAKGQLQQRVLQAALDQAHQDKSLAMVRAVDAAGFNPGRSVHLELPVASGVDVSMRPGSSITITALTPMQKALRERDEKTVLARVKAGGSPPSLGGLVRGRMTSVVRHQLAAGANPNLADAGGNTPLIEAVLDRNSELVDVLLAAGADVNLPGEEEVTPLIAALQGDKPVELSLVERLLAAQADINKANRTRTPLMEAVSRCLPKAVTLLLRKGARWDVPPDGGAGLYEEAVVPRLPCPEKLTVQVVRVLREGGVPLQHPDASHLDWLRVRARESPMLGPELSLAGLRPEKAEPPSPPGAAR